MKTLQYKKNEANRRRVMTSAELEAIGIELKSDLVWEEANYHRVEVSDKNAEILMDRLPGEFEVVVEDEVEDIEETPEPESDEPETDEDDDSEEEPEDD